MRSSSIIFAADFETTSYEGQDYTEVWAAACCELYKEEVKVFHSLEEQFEFFASFEKDLIVYYHNLKFDGSFWLPYLLQVRGYKQGIDGEGVSERFKPPKSLLPGEFIYSISAKGQWYRIIIKTENNTIEIRDSLKLLPFSLKRIGESFNTKHKKLEMEYVGQRYAGCAITQNEEEYIKNDVYVLKEALEITFEQGHTSLTIGACCLGEFKRLIGKKKYDDLFPDMYEIPLDEGYGSKTAGDYIHQSYYGGWTYLVEEKANKVYKGGVTADVNSLYPYVMHSESGNYYPKGLPTFWRGNNIPVEAQAKNRYFFVRIRTRFYVRDGYLPFIQIKNSLLYNPTKHLRTSDVYNHVTGRYQRKIKDTEGNEIDTHVILTLTMTDFYRLQDHYTLEDFEILDGCWFECIKGVFDGYIDKYKQIKTTSKGAVRELAKLFSNNLYGKLSASNDSSFKVATECEDGVLRFRTVIAKEKKPGYIPVGSAITSYARDYTIRAAQRNYYGENSRGFIYADTDSIHCDLMETDLIEIPQDDITYGCFKIELKWDEAIFVRQKTYVEKVGNTVKITCAGMPDACKDILRERMAGETVDQKQHMELKDFRRGLTVPGKLFPRRIKGGIVLKEGEYRIK